ncbi:hypothetical protein SOCE26_053450 [Sorangium cellulosum]|uniref:Secreted protein n=1 Tax=Sorangium cellulosum TaxID=56 RepID=A0A2L0EXC1_SORCE|nr:hypothetical protein [Sorangium cellulosum]AUX43889.1 hypothetical protein SOCE26_053450 [Sorangium cellulosum]
MRRCFSLLLTLLSVPLSGLGLAAGCGHTVIVDDPSADGGGGGQAGAPPDPSGGGGADAGTKPLDEYVDPGCPDAPPPITDFQCDPYNQASGFCAPGEGCFIFVQYPDEPCGQEIYGAFCAPAGSGGQGDPCGGLGECGAGFACVVTGSGTQCVELCPLTGDDNCGPGFVCEPIDVEGIGGCL